MQIENNTDEAIVLQPGECIRGDSTIKSFEGKSYRVVMDRVNQGPERIEEFTTPIDRHMAKFDDH